MFRNRTAALPLGGALDALGGKGGGWGLRRLTFLLYGHRDVRLALVCPHGLPLARELITYNTQFCLLAENGFATTRYKLPERRY